MRIPDLSPSAATSEIPGSARVSRAGLGVSPKRSLILVVLAVTPPERPAAASFTAVPRSLASALGPTLAGALLAVGWVGAPLVACGVLKIGYDLALLGVFRRVKLTE